MLLNSDTLVNGDWLDRMVATARSMPEIGTATPFSNNATICSYPDCNVENDFALEIDDAALDRIAATVNAGRWVPIPTAVGFCMLIKRACIEAIGLFDHATFGRGYGEEVDFCQRAKAAGWINGLVGSVFVRHFGSASFGLDKPRLNDASAVRLQEAPSSFQRRRSEMAGARSCRRIARAS